MRQFYDTFSTPVGDFSVATDATGAIIATAFGDLSALKKRFVVEEIVRDVARIHRIRTEIAEYFSGSSQCFSAKLSPSGTPFQQNVWAALLRVPFGETCSYGELAAKSGSPDAARAIGRANATNPICLFIPCHRVIGRDGSLTGYAFGEKKKRWLINHEKALIPLFVG